ncbi:MAG: tetratricopeptide repeat protein [Phycisphaerales bacterium]|nr:MAG: tetratricopeptide repeat protein [Phycisphaerales bacterium]
MNFQVERLKRLPQRTKETWQGGLTRLPLWVQGEDRTPYRPWIAGWVSIKTKLVHATEPQESKEKSFEMALNALTDFACNQELAGYRPTKIEVRDSALAEHLGRLLAEAGIEVEQRNKLFTFDQIIADLAEHVDDHPTAPSALAAKGVTVELMWAFADAAAQYYRAKPWQQFMNEDLIEVESPFVDPALRYLTVLGSGGTTFGLGFYDSVSQFESLFEQTDPTSFAVDKHWVLFFEPITTLPLGDADLWEDHGLPVADVQAYPAAFCLEPDLKQRRPGPDILCYLEGLMRSLALTTEDEMDSGRWAKAVLTARGEVEYTLSLPDLLKPDAEESKKKTKKRGGIPDPRTMERTQLDIQRLIDERDFESMDEMQSFLNENVVGREVPHKAAQTPLEQAQDLVYEALEARGRRQLRLLRRALEICPDCADAFVLLAERSSDTEKARDLYAQGVAAGERALGEKLFKEEAGHFWGMLQTRPYMRARLGLAQCLEELGRLEEAAGHYRELLRLNPNDNQGVRYVLLPCLLEMQADDEASELLKRYKEDKQASWCYAKALLTFRQKGDTATARKHLKKALDVNRHVAEYLRAYEDMPEFLPSGYSPGSEEEAIVCAAGLVDAWEQTEGAPEWLDERTKKP